VSRTADVLSSFAASTLALGGGYSVGPLGPRPETPLELYEFEACPFCRRVREALTVLDLEAMIYPCPKGGQRFRPRATELDAGKGFPLLVDPNTGTTMRDSPAIVKYLFATYGAGSPPLHMRGPSFAAPLGSLASAARFGRGARAVLSRAREKPLELWSFEASPYCRVAREALCELELPYLLHNVAKKSPSRPAFIARSNKMMVPYLADPNTGIEMHESADIAAYLHATYGDTHRGPNAAE